jgi:hypothetical protein
MRMYPEVRTHVDTTLHWSSVEVQRSANSTISHCILLEASHQKVNSGYTMRPLIVVTDI